MKQEDLLSVSDFFVTLIRGWRAFLLVWILIMAAVVTYLFVATKSYKLTGTIYVGRFQRILIEEGEFVAEKLQDYSFVSRALKNANVEVDIPVSRLTRDITTNVVNEIKKVRDVGIVEVTVEYKDRQKTYDIYKAITDQLVADHKILFEASSNTIKGMADEFWKDEAILRENIKNNQKTMADATARDLTATVPSFLLLGHTMAEQRASHQKLIKDIHYLLLEADSATNSFNTKLASEPVLPDEPHKPKRVLVLLIGLILATIGGMSAALGLDFYNYQIKPKLS